MCVSVCLSDPVSTSLVQSVMSMASSHSQHSHISTDTMSSMSGSYLAGAEGEPGGDEGGDAEGDENQDAPMESRGPSQQDGEFSQEPKEQNYSVAVEEQDSEGNDVTEEDCSSPSNGKGGRSRCPELANNNQGVALCDTPSLGLDNEQAPDSRFADEESCPVHIED
ncbi:RING finger protein 157-like isoform X3 [Notothenia coriiceps]|nr:PREDICTED: RING finger protein 157-like isoform X3 [Notothenia coriiceps]